MRENYVLTYENTCVNIYEKNAQTIKYAKLRLVLKQNYGKIYDTTYEQTYNKIRLATLTIEPKTHENAETCGKHTINIETHVRNHTHIGIDMWTPVEFIMQLPTITIVVYYFLALYMILYYSCSLVSAVC
jgi:hypothetical protein